MKPKATSFVDESAKKIVLFFRKRKNTKSTMLHSISLPFPPVSQQAKRDTHITQHLRSSLWIWRGQGETETRRRCRSGSSRATLKRTRSWASLMNSGDWVGRVCGSHWTSNHHSLTTAEISVPNPNHRPSQPETNLSELQSSSQDKKSSDAKQRR